MVKIFDIFKGYSLFSVAGAAKERPVVRYMSMCEFQFDVDKYGDNVLLNSGKAVDGVAFSANHIWLPGDGSIYVDLPAGDTLYALYYDPVMRSFSKAALTADTFNMVNSFSQWLVLDVEPLDSDIEYLNGNTSYLGYMIIEQVGITPLSFDFSNVINYIPCAEGTIGGDQLKCIVTNNTYAISGYTSDCRSKLANVSYGLNTMLYRQDAEGTVVEYSRECIHYNADGRYIYTNLSAGEIGSEPMVMLLDITANDTVCSFQIEKVSEHAFANVLWGDGKLESFSQDATGTLTISHTYSEPGLCLLKIYGDMDNVEFSVTDSVLGVAKKVEFGDMVLHNSLVLELMFANRTNLESVAFNTKVQHKFDSLNGTFAGCVGTSVSFNDIMNDGWTGESTFADASDVSVYDMARISGKPSSLKEMFKNVHFSNPSGLPDIGLLDLSQCADMTDMFAGATGLTTEWFDNTLVLLANQNVQSGITIDFGDAMYTNAGDSYYAYRKLTVEKGWTIKSAGPVPEIQIVPCNRSGWSISESSKWNNNLAGWKAFNCTIVDGGDAWVTAEKVPTPHWLKITQTVSDKSPYYLLNIQMRGRAVVSNEHQRDRSPKILGVEGSMDGTVWDEIEIIDNSAILDWKTTNTIPITNRKTAYRHFRLTWIENFSVPSAGAQMGWIKLFGYKV